MALRDRFLAAYHKLFLQNRKLDEFEQLGLQYIGDIDDLKTAVTIAEAIPPIPDFEPRRTVAFLGMSKGSCIHWYNKNKIRRKIRCNACWFLEHGYDCFVVDYGTQYGRASLEELVDLRRQGEKFTLCCGKMRGENFGGTTLDLMLLIGSCDIPFGILERRTFKEKVIDKVSAVSVENGPFFIEERLPKWLADQWRDA